MARPARTRWVLLLLLLVVVVAGGWWIWSEGGDLWRKEPPIAASTVSPEVALQAEERLQSLQGGRDAVHLSGAELTSLMRYRMSELVPEGVQNTAVAIVGDTLQLSGRYATDRLPDHPKLRTVRLLLPDTADVILEGRMLPETGGVAALELTRFEFANIPVPRDFYPQILEQMGIAGDRPMVIQLPLPEGVSEASLENGVLVLVPSRS